jgi:hypothetical protein
VRSLPSVRHQRHHRGEVLLPTVAIHRSATWICPPEPGSTCSRSAWQETVGAHAGLLPASDGAGQVVEVLDTWGDVLGLDGVSPSLTDRFRGRAFASGRAALGPPDPHSAPGLG